jgi:hypothetical protein
MTATADQVD